MRPQRNSRRLLRVGKPGLDAGRPRAASTATGPAPALVCITPTSDVATVEVTTIAGQKVRLRAADQPPAGRAQPISAKGCSGTQQAWWSSDERRSYLTSSGELRRPVTDHDGDFRMTPRVTGSTSRPSRR